MAVGSSPAVAKTDAPPTPVAAARADIEKMMGFVPRFFLDMPDVALPGVWQ